MSAMQLMPRAAPAPAPQSQKKRERREYETTWPLWQTLTQTEQQPLGLGQAARVAVVPMLLGKVGAGHREGAHAARERRRLVAVVRVGGAQVHVVRRPVARAVRRAVGRLHLAGAAARAGALLARVVVVGIGQGQRRVAAAAAAAVGRGKVACVEDLLKEAENVHRAAQGMVRRRRPRFSSLDTPVAVAAAEVGGAEEDDGAAEDDAAGSAQAGVAEDEVALAQVGEEPDRRLDELRQARRRHRRGAAT